MTDYGKDSQWVEHHVENVADAPTELYLGQDGSGTWKLSTDPADAGGYLAEDGNQVNKIDGAASSGKKVVRIGGTARIEE